MTAPTEKAAPIPAEDMMDTVAGILASHAGRKYVLGSDLELAEEIVEALADREARPSLPDSREERDRIEAEAYDWLWVEAGEDDRSVVQDWIVKTTGGRMHPNDRARARQGGNNG